jgi:hypothetical protein
MEAAMRRASIIVSFALLAAALLVSGRAEAGASASAPSKYTHSSQVVTHQAPAIRQARKSDYPITEYSSSSFRTHAANGR